MADINQQSDELAQEFERLRNAVQNNGEGLDRQQKKQQNLEKLLQLVQKCWPVDSKILHYK